MIRKWLIGIVCQAISMQKLSKAWICLTNRNPKENDNRFYIGTMWHNTETKEGFCLTKLTAEWTKIIPGQSWEDYEKEIEKPKE